VVEMPFSYQPDIHQCRCSLPVNFEEDSMRESKVKGAAVDYICQNYSLDPSKVHLVAREGYNWGKHIHYFNQKFENLCWEGEYDNDLRLALRAIDPDFDIDLTDACWYPDLKPQAKLILKECGVQTYEVEAITEELSDYYTGNLEGAQTLHVEKKAVSGGVQFQVTSSDLSGAYLTSDYDTAKQLLESLGYEVVE